VDGRGSGSYVTSGFGISSVELSDSDAAVVVN
jgi:hypothetical protein